MNFDEVKPAAINVCAAAGGAVLGGLARKKIDFLNTKAGQFVQSAVGIALSISQKSQILKGLGTGLAINGVLGLCDGFLGENNTVKGLGEVYTDSDGFTYVSGIDGEDEPQMIQMEDGSYMLVEEEDEDSVEGFAGPDDLMV